MKEMSQNMQFAMDMAQGQMIDENIEDLRKIIENLITFLLSRKA